MSKIQAKTDLRQLELPFSERVEVSLKETENVFNAITHREKTSKIAENFEDACMELAGAIKKAVKASCFSRDEVADKINRYFGWPTKKEMDELRSSGKDKGVKHLSRHMWSHYLSKPVDYPIPGAYLYAIQDITGSLEVCRSLAEAEDAKIITKEECDTLMVGKMYDARIEISRLMGEFKKKGDEIKNGHKRYTNRRSAWRIGIDN